ncbi:hypothetical protein Efla_007402 [Eimeria flavescens]
MSQQQSDLKPRVQQVCERLIDCFATRLQKDDSLGISEEVKSDFIRAAGAEPSADFGSRGGELSAERRKPNQAADSDDEFENAQVDSVGLSVESDELGFLLCREEKDFLRENKLEAPPPLGDLTEAPRDRQTRDKLIGTFDKVLRPAEISRGLLTQERTASWSFSLSYGLMNVGGQEFVVDRLHADVREV